MKIDYNLLAAVFFGVAPFASAFLLYLHKMDKQISVLRNDITWLKLKACQRRNSDFVNTSNEE